MKNRFRFQNCVIDTVDRGCKLQTSNSGDAVLQTGNAIAFGDQYNPKQTLLAGGLGGLAGGVTGALTVPKGANPWTGKQLAETTQELTENATDLYARYGDKANDLMFASGNLPKNSNYAVTKIGSDSWQHFNSLDELDAFVRNGSSIASSASNSSAGLTVNGFLNFRRIKGGFLINNSLRIQSHTHYLSPIKGRGYSGIIN